MPLQLLHPGKDNAPTAIEGEIHDLAGVVVPLGPDVVGARRATASFVGDPPLVVKRSRRRKSKRKRRSGIAKTERRLAVARPLSLENLRDVVALETVPRREDDLGNPLVEGGPTSPIIVRTTLRLDLSLVPERLVVHCGAAVRSADPAITGRMSVLGETLAKIVSG